MGVDYRGSVGYGVVLSENNDDLESMATRVGFSVDDNFDSYEFLEWLCKKYQLSFVTAGDHYSGDVFYLIGAGFTVWRWGFEEVNYGFFDIESSPELDNALQQLIVDLGIPWRRIGFYAGLEIS